LLFLDNAIDTKNDIRFCIFEIKYSIERKKKCKLYNSHSL